MGSEYPDENTIAGRVMGLVVTQSEPVSIHWICDRLIKRPRHLSRAMERLIKHGWLLEVGDDVKRYQASDKVQEHLAAVRPRWDDDDHRAWMSHYRAQFVARVKLEVINRGRRT